MYVSELLNGVETWSTQRIGWIWDGAWWVHDVATTRTPRNLFANPG
jgi:hypothetical protein